MATDNYSHVDTHSQLPTPELVDTVETILTNTETPVAKLIALKNIADGTEQTPDELLLGYLNSQRSPTDLSPPATAEDTVGTIIRKDQQQILTLSPAEIQERARITTTLDVYHAAAQISASAEDPATARNTLSEFLFTATTAGIIEQPAPILEAIEQHGCATEYTVDELTQTLAEQAQVQQTQHTDSDTPTQPSQGSFQQTPDTGAASRQQEPREETQTTEPDSTDTDASEQPAKQTQTNHNHTGSPRSASHSSQEERHTSQSPAEEAAQTAATTNSEGDDEETEGDTAHGEKNKQENTGTLSDRDHNSDAATESSTQPASEQAKRTPEDAASSEPTPTENGETTTTDTDHTVRPLTEFKNDMQHSNATTVSQEPSGDSSNGAHPTQQTNSVSAEAPRSEPRTPPSEDRTPPTETDPSGTASAGTEAAETSDDDTDAGADPDTTPTTEAQIGTGQSDTPSEHRLSAGESESESSHRSDTGQGTDTQSPEAPEDEQPQTDASSNPSSPSSSQSDATHRDRDELDTDTDTGSLQDTTHKSQEVDGPQSETDRTPEETHEEESGAVEPHGPEFLSIVDASQSIQDPDSAVSDSQTPHGTQEDDSSGQDRSQPTETHSADARAETQSPETHDTEALEATAPAESRTQHTDEPSPTHESETQPASPTHSPTQTRTDPSSGHPHSEGPDSSPHAQTPDEPDSATFTGTHPEETESGPAADAHRTQNLVPVDYIYSEDAPEVPDGVNSSGFIKHGNMRYLGLIEITPRNWSVLQADEQDAIAQQFVSEVYSSLEFPVCAVVAESQLNSEDYTQTLKARQQEVTQGSREEDPLLTIGRRVHMEWIDQWLDHNDITTRQMYLAVAVTPEHLMQHAETRGLIANLADLRGVGRLFAPFAPDPEDNVTKQDLLTELDSRLTQVISQLKGTDLGATRVTDPQQVSHVLYQLTQHQDPPAELPTEFGPLVTETLTGADSAPSNSPPERPPDHTPPSSSYADSEQTHQTDTASTPPDSAQTDQPAQDPPDPDPQSSDTPPGHSPQQVSAQSHHSSTSNNS
jgi:hypothetical protein